MAGLGADLPLREELLCPICLELFTDPVILGCGHNFCRRCVQEFWQHRPPAPLCPECREPAVPGHLRCNRVVQQLSDASRLDGHRYCPEHGLRIQLFCHTDNRLICLGCRDGPEHRDHRASPTQEAAQAFKDKLQTEMASTRDRSAAFSRFQCSLRDKESEVKRSSQQLLLHIREEFAEMHSFLQKKEESLARDLAEQEDRTLQQIQGNLQNVQGGLDSLELRLQELMEYQAHEDDIEFLKECGEFWERLKVTLRPSLSTLQTVSKLRPDTIQMPSEVPAVLPLGEFKGPLQYKVWREMKDFIKPAPVPLLFDRMGLHQELPVSDDPRLRNRQRQQLLPAVRMFGPPLAEPAAGSTGSGRHYWEAEVGAALAWDLGLASESMRRERGIAPTPARGYWLIRLRDGDGYQALDRSAVPLHPSARLRRVGVYLDYEAGQVSFYNADDMYHLYTFKDTFTERVFPYFRPLLLCGDSAEGLALRIFLP